MFNLSVYPNNIQYVVKYLSTFSALSLALSFVGRYQAYYYTRRCASGRPGPGGLPALGPGGGALLRKAPPPLSREALLQRPEDAPSPVGSGCCCCGGGGGGGGGT